MTERAVIENEPIATHWIPKTKRELMDSFDEHIAVNLKGVGKHEGAMFDAHLGGKPYVWIGDSKIGCFVAVEDLRVLRKMRDTLDVVIAKREHRGAKP